MDYCIVQFGILLYTGTKVKCLETKDRWCKKSGNIELEVITFKDYVKRVESEEKYKRGL